MLTYCKVCLLSVDHTYHSGAIVAPAASSPIFIGWPYNGECEISRLLHKQDELPQDTAVSLEGVGCKAIQYFFSQKNCLTIAHRKLST